MKKNEVKASYKKYIIGTILIVLTLISIIFFSIMVNAEGAEETTKVVEDEKSLIRMTSSMSKGEDADRKVNKDTLQTLLNRYIGSEKATVAEKDSNTLLITFAKTGNEYEIDINKGPMFDSVDSDGSGTGGNAGTTVDRTGLSVGDYVNYTYDSAEDYSLSKAVSGGYSDQTIAQTSDLKWRIMSINSDGSVDLVAETVTTATVRLKGALGYNNGVYVLNDIAEKQYSNTSLGVTARSLKIEDIENQMNETGKTAIESFELDFDGDGVITENEIKYGQEVTLTTYKYYPNLYAYENGAGINTTEVKTNGIDGSDTGERVLTMPTTETYSQAGENGLTVKSNVYKWGTTPSNYFDSSEFYNLIFGTSKYYWVASRFANSYYGCATFGLRDVCGSALDVGSLFYSDEVTREDSLALRPVVSLGSDIQITVSEGENSSENQHEIRGPGDRTGLSVGDYVNYTYDSAEDYSLSAAVSGYTSDQTIVQTSDLKWRIMSINSDGSVDLVAETATTATVGLQGALGYNNGVYVLNDIAEKQYSNTSLGVTARSLKIEDIENQMNETGKTAIESFEQNGVKYGQEVTLTTYIYYPNLYAYENGAGINTTEVKTNGIDGSDTGERVLTMPTTETYSLAGGNGLTVKTNMYAWGTTPSNYFDSSEFYNLIFGTSTSNWVASRFAGSYGGLAYFGLRYVDGSGLSGDRGLLFYSGGWTPEDSLALRPVVSLGSDIQITVSEGENSSENQHTIVVGN